MDEMTIKSEFLKGIISSFITKAIKKNTGISTIITFKGPIEFQKDSENADLDLHFHISCPVDDISLLISKLL